MLLTIRWMVEREPQDQQQRVGTMALSWFLLGGVAGGLVGGLLVALVARVLFTLFNVGPSTGLMAAAIVAAVYGLQFVGSRRFHLIQFKNQVPLAWRELFNVPTASFFYAGSLGFAFLTRLTTPVFYAFVFVLLGLGRWPLVVIALFGLAGLLRASTALSVSVFDWFAIGNQDMIGRLEAMETQVKKVEVGLLLTLAGGLSWLAIR